MILGKNEQEQKYVRIIISNIKHVTAAYQKSFKYFHYLIA